MIEHPDSQSTATCTYCPKLCRVACPVSEAEKRETVTPWGLMNAIHAHAEGHSVLAGEGAEILWHCSGCRRCQQHCQDHIDVPAAVQGARFEAFQRGDAPQAARAQVARFQAHGNPFGRALNASACAAVHDKDADATADVVLFADCATVARYPEQLQPTLKVLEAAGVPARLHAKDISCCGAPLYHAGDLEGFTRHARAVHKALRSKALVIVPNPGCAHVMRDLYPEVGYGLPGEVKHPAELLGERIERLPLTARASRTVYQDPCHLTRSLGQAEAPRALLHAATGARPREPFMSGARGMCTGGGGGLPEMLPEVARAVAEQARDNLAAEPGETVVTACPGCRHRLELAGTPAPIKDLMEVLSEAL